MDLLYVFLSVAVHVWLSSATQVFYVLPDNDSTIARCPSKPCATLSQYLLENDTLPAVSDVEYRLLPGEHHLYSIMILSNLKNFSFVATQSNVPVILATCTNITDYDLYFQISIINSYNVTIGNMMFRHCDPARNTMYLYLSVTTDFKLENITFMHGGLTGQNVFRNLIFNNVTIEYHQY